jgi:uncharacterized protein (DUF58 family)
VSKFEYARQMAAGLAYLMISQRDAVGLITFDDAIRTMIPALSAPSHFSVVCKSLSDARIGGETPVSSVLHSLAERIRRRGLVIILSDGFDKLDDLTNALQHLRHRRHEVLFFQVLAPEEEDFPFRRPARFRNLENLDQRLLVDPAAMRKAYLEKFHAFQESLVERIRAMGADYHKASTAVPLDQTIVDYLATRTSRGRSGSPRAQGGVS